MGNDYQLIPAKRKTISIQITPAGEVVVRYPRRMHLAQVQSFVESKGGWIKAKLEKLASQPQLPPLTEEERSALRRQAQEDFEERTARFAPLVGVDYGRITIRSQKTRWGSCSSKGNLNFNCLLMLVPPEVRDYVVVHELCHRKEMNHSARFWTQVERVLPGYSVQKQWLKDHGAELMGRLEGERRNRNVQ